MSFWKSPPIQKPWSRWWFTGPFTVTGEFGSALPACGRKPWKKTATSAPASNTLEMHNKKAAESQALPPFTVLLFFPENQPFAGCVIGNHHQDTGNQLDPVSVPPEQIHRHKDNGRFHGPGA